MKKYHATILIVDDDENDLFFIEKAFRDVGVTEPIYLARGGEEGIAYMKGEGKFADRTKYVYPTFVMTDLNMPRVNGFAVLDYLKRHPDYGIIPTVIWSSSADPDDVKKSYHLGASSYHVKPTSLPELRSQLKVLHDYWMTCHTPLVDLNGKQLATAGEGKLGEDFPTR
ncbi:response regulator [Oleiharenicola lentus]|uniref:response regulator n=1 Tax=Oleiharenicola lentus TaxID=2508720 RepID=UPI003F675A7D